MTNTQMRSLGWMVVLAICAGMFVVLSIRVHAVKSEVMLTERKIVSLKKQNRLLETEFETRANQRQLANWNSVEFGFEAPRADQYLDGERQLAAPGQPRSPDAPGPIRVASADLADPEALANREMVSPVTGERINLAAVGTENADAAAIFADAFGDFLIEASPIRAANAKASDKPAAFAAAQIGADASGAGE